MWKLYDDLYIGIPSGLRITGCIVGEKWTTVRANGNVGIARTLEQPEDPEKFAMSYIGAYLRDTGNYMKWDTLAKAGIGVAALNAWYNTAERVAGLNGMEPHVAKGSVESVVYVGDYTGETVLPLPMSEDFDYEAYACLKGASVVISADALTTKALPKLLDIVGREGSVRIEGYSLPATALFFSFGMPVRALCGHYQKCPETVDACALKGVADPSAGVSNFCIHAERFALL